MENDLGVRDWKASGDRTKREKVSGDDETK